MTVLVLGATGFIGPHVVGALAAAGHAAIGASRSGAGPHGAALDRRDAAAVKALVRARRVTAVVDLLAYTEADTVPLLEAVDGEVGRWVMASSCDVYRNYEGLHRKAAPAPITAALDETSPLRTIRHPYRAEPRRLTDAPDAWMDDYDKIPLEAALMARPSLGGVVLRLPMVFGPGDRQRRFRWIVSPMLAGEPRLAADPAWLGWRTTYGYVADVAHALATAAVHPAAAGRVFNVGRSDVGEHRDWIERFAAALDWNGEVTEARAGPQSPLAALDLRYPLICDTRAFRETCGWREPTDFEDALTRTAEDERRR
ncbi:MAG TPA: NAD-dependent epimerase/dehydratase family protein [Caulobacteraceae bacterium]|nr:NAD-dependent epimerase/dehydratase family protein [Caulobacteraceae bacterium]